MKRKHKHFQQIRLLYKYYQQIYIHRLACQFKYLKRKFFLKLQILLEYQLSYLEQRKHNEHYSSTHTLERKLCAYCRRTCHLISKCRQKQFNKRANFNLEMQTQQKISTQILITFNLVSVQITFKRIITIIIILTTAFIPQQHNHLQSNL